MDTALKRRTSLETVATLLMASLLCLGAVPETYAADNGGENLSSVTIQGDKALLSFTPDLCSSVGLGSCKVGVSLDESFAEQVQVMTSVDRQVLKPNDPVTLTESLAPSSGTATLGVTFNLGSKNYAASYTIQTQAIGSGTLSTISIPLSAILAAVGIPLVFPVPGSFSVSPQITSNLQGATSVPGFSGGGNLQWSAAGANSETVSFMGNQDVSSLGLNSLTDTQQWQLSFDITNLPLVGQVHLYTATIGSQQYHSGPPGLIAFYHVVLEQPVGGAITSDFGSAWYISGYQLALTAQPSDSYSFQSWSAGGQNLSVSSSYAFMVLRPMDITASFVKLSPAQGVAQGVTGLLESPFGWVAILLVLGVIVGFAVWRSRRHPSSVPTGL